LRRRDVIPGVIGVEHGGLDIEPGDELGRILTSRKPTTHNYFSLAIMAFFLQASKKWYFSQ